MEGILSQHGLSSSLWEATFLGEDSWRLCSLLQKQREKRMPPASPPWEKQSCCLGNQWMGNQCLGNQWMWKSSTYDTDSVLGLFLPLLELSPQAQFRFLRAVTLGPHFSGSLHMLHHTTWVWLLFFPPQHWSLSKILLFIHLGSSWSLAHK